MKSRRIFQSLAMKQYYFVKSLPIVLIPVLVFIGIAVIVIRILKMRRAPRK